MLTTHNKRQHKHEQYAKHKNIPRMKTNTKSIKIHETHETRLYIEASNDHLTTIQIYEKTTATTPLVTTKTKKFLTLPSGCSSDKSLNLGCATIFFTHSLARLRYLNASVV